MDAPLTSSSIFFLIESIVDLRHSLFSPVLAVTCLQLDTCN